MAILNWICDFLRPTARWQRENEPFRHWLCFVLREAIRDKADRISLMTPRECLAATTEVDSEPSAGDAQHVNLREEMLREIGVPSQDEGEYPPVFLRKRNIAVPVWVRVSGKWKQVDGIPIYVFHKYIETMIKVFTYDGEVDPRSHRVILRLVDGTKVYTEFWFEPDFTYTIVIGDVILPPAPNDP